MINMPKKEQGEPVVGKACLPALEFVAVDVETTGLNPYQERLIEIAAVRFRDGCEVGAFETLVDPERPLPERIVELTGIDGRMLEGAPKEAEALEAFLDFAGGAVLLGHNLIFDYGFLKCAIERRERLGLRQVQELGCRGVDTLGLARKYLPELPSRSLEALCSYFRIEQPAAHRALADARSAASLYGHLFTQFGDMGEAELVFPLKKTEPITAAQKNYLNDLLKYHKIECNIPLEQMTKSEASRMIDKIILEHGKPAGRPRGSRASGRQRP